MPTFSMTRREPTLFGIAHRGDAVQAQLLESEAEHESYCLGGEALSPTIGAQAVTDVGAAELGRDDAEADHADELVTAPFDDAEVVLHARARAGFFLHVAQDLRLLGDRAHGFQRHVTEEARVTRPGQRGGRVVGADFSQRHPLALQRDRVEARAVALRVTRSHARAYSDRRRTRSLIGVGPKSNASRSLRSRYRM